MNFKQIILLSLLASTAEAHFRIPYPGERDPNNTATQTEGPCGGSNSIVLPRYKWNPKGSPIDISYEHDYGIGAIYFCGSENCTSGSDFDVLVYEPYDQTVGNFCIPSVQLPDEYNKINTTGVLQVAYSGPKPDTGELHYMFSCIDIIVSDDGPIYDGQCHNDTIQAVFDKAIDEEVKDNNNEQLSAIASFTYISSGLESRSASEASKASGSGSAKASGSASGSASAKASSSASASASASGSASGSAISSAAGCRNSVSASGFVLTLFSFLF